MEPLITAAARALVLLRHNLRYPLILRSFASKRLEGRGPEASTGASWFETALTRLLAMRI